MVLVKSKDGYYAAFFSTRSCNESDNAYFLAKSKFYFLKYYFKP